MRRILVLILAAAAIASLCACSLIGSVKTIDSKEEINYYIIDLIGADIGDYFAENEMEIKKESSKSMPRSGSASSLTRSGRSKRSSKIRYQKTPVIM